MILYCRNKIHSQVCCG